MSVLKSFGEDSPDLSTCDIEPIHVPGHIQPHGVLIATDPDTLRISHVSANFEAETGIAAADVLGADVQRLFGNATAALQHSLASEAYSPANVLNVTLPIPVRPTRHVMVHRHVGRTMIELEAAPPAGIDRGAPLTKAQSIVAGLRRASTVADLIAYAARELRYLTGYDRVMIYRFDESGAGTVVAEDKIDDLESFLDLRYPASDIPAQARRLYVLQRARAIPDIEYVPVPLLSLATASARSAGDTPVDMSFCSLRGVSPVHREYLRNMGVRATLTISLLQDSELWGMIVCHHGTPLTPSAETRALCDMIGQLLSVLLLRVSETEELAGSLAQHQVTARLRSSIETRGLVEGLGDESEAMLDLMGAAGVMIRFSGTTKLFGQTPPQKAAEAIVHSLRERHGEAIVGIDDAGRTGGIAEQHADTASGILFMPVANNPGDAIAWFRPEIVRTVRWGGDPRKAMAPEPDGRLSPRKSFAAWTEQVRGSSRPWTAGDLRAAQDMRRAVTASLLRQAEIQLAQLSAYDALTGLANRRTLEAALERWQAEEHHGPGTLIFLDVDRFKTINDTMGHAAGDDVLTEVATRLRRVAPSASLTGRLGGDEFVLFWPGAGPAEAMPLAETLLAELARPFLLQGKMYYAGGSIGVACETPEHMEDLLRQADAAMYASKRAGGGQVTLYRPEIHATVLSNMQTEQDLFLALENNELEVHYQPIVRVPDRTIQGFEALVRWRHPVRGWISPAEFIPRAEEAGLISRVGAWVMAQAVHQLAVWQKLHAGLTMSVNVAGRQLTEGSLSGALKALLATEKVAAATICLEVTESALMNDVAVRELHELKSAGVRIAVDDFGTGYSSLSHLQLLPVSLVKIDRSFVTPLGSNARDDSFFRAVVDLAHTIDLRAVAEGVETEAQWDVTAATKCDLVQGWLIGRARDATATTELLQRQLSVAGP